VELDTRVASDPEIQKMVDAAISQWGEPGKPKIKNIPPGAEEN
jgi:hypothetical protein